MTVNWLQAFAGAVLGLLLGSLVADSLKRLWSLVAQVFWEGRVPQVEGAWDSTYW